MGNNLSASQITESLFQSMDTLIAARLAEVSFDRTVVCEIIDDTAKLEGKYIVQKDLTKFDAYSDGTAKYSVGEKVNVLVPEGNYKNQKVIVGKYQETDKEPIAYVQPLGTLVPMATIQIPNPTSGSFGLIANQDTSDDIKGTTCAVWQVNLLDTSQEAVLKNNGIYNSLGISARFKTLLGDKQIYKGTYGLRIDLGEVKDGVVSSLHTFELNTEDMFGDPYNYLTYFKFSKMLDISELGPIGPVKITLYQNSNFEYYTPEGTTELYDIAKHNNILVQDVELLLGEDASIIADNTFKINTYDGLEYSSETEKEIYSTWYNKDNNTNEYIGYLDMIPDDDDDYDEYKYQQELKANYAGAMLAGDETVPDSKESLQIYYNKDLIATKYATLSNYYTKDMQNYLLNLEKNLSVLGISGYDNDFANIGNAIRELGPELFFFSCLDNADDNVKTGYYNFLVECKNYLDGSGTVPDEDEVPSYGDVATAITAPIKKINQNITDLINTLSSITELQNYLNSVKANFDVSGAKGLEVEARTLVETTDDLVATLYDNVLSGNVIAFSDEYEAFKKQYENRYYIGWYRAVANVVDVLAGAGWEKVGTSRPESGAGANQMLTYMAECAAANTSEQYKAILFYNHIAYESNILEFTNLNPPKGSNDVDKINTLIIEMGENAKDLYTSYSSYFTLINSVDKHIRRHLLASHRDGTTELFANSYIYWYVPESNTMINPCDEKYLTSTYGLSVYSDTNSVHFKEGYYNYYRKLNSTVDETQLGFAYLISDYYNPNYVNNTIYCKIVDDTNVPYEAEHRISFDTFGSNGTDYTLSVRPSGIAAALMPNSNSSGYELNLDVRLTDPDGNVMSDKSPELTITQDSGNYIATSGYTLKINSYPANNYHYGIAVAKINNQQITADIVADQTLTLTAQYPIALANGRYYIDGPTTIVYSSQGNNPEYLDSPYRIYKMENDQEITNVTWSIEYYDSDDSYASSSERGGQPTLQNQKTGVHLKPSPMYLTNDRIKSSVICKDASGNILWVQPLLILQNQYPSSRLNQWDESLTIDKEKGILLSTMVGAGYKDASNVFNGVLMGDIGAIVDGSPQISATGLFGYKAGAQTFSLTIDGILTLGASGTGQITFDGTAGIIKSSNYSVSRNIGTYINLKDGSFDFGGKITFNGTNSLTLSGVSLQWTDINNKPNLATAETVSALQTQVDQMPTTIHTYIDDNWVISPNIQGGYLRIADTNNTTYAEITTNGILRCAGAEISGNITATSGTIGGCDITGGTLYITNANISGKITADHIDATFLTVDAANITGTLTAAEISADKITNGTNSATITFNGAFTAPNATITGTITANYLIANSGGEIGGWKISANGIESTTYGNLYLYSNCPSYYSVNGSASKNDWRILAYNSNTGAYTFGLDKLGNLYATSVNLSGTINASSGKIGDISLGTFTYSYPSAFTLGSISATDPNNGYGIYTLSSVATSLKSVNTALGTTHIAYCDIKNNIGKINLPYTFLSGSSNTNVTIALPSVEGYNSAIDFWSNNSILYLNHNLASLYYSMATQNVTSLDLSCSIGNKFWVTSNGTVVCEHILPYDGITKDIVLYDYSSGSGKKTTFSFRNGILIGASLV